MKAAFLDRDGTIIQGGAFVNRVGDMISREFVPGVVPVLAWLQRSGYELVIVTNQGGIGAGHLTLCMHDRIMDVLDCRLRNCGIFLTGMYACIHHPDSGCGCRKPKPGLLQRAASDLGIDLSQSVMIGDQPSDVQAGIAAGCRRSLQLEDEDWVDVMAQLA